MHVGTKVALDQPTGSEIHIRVTSAQLLEIYMAYLLQGTTHYHILLRKHT